MLKEIILTLADQDLDYDSIIVLSQLPEETVWFKGKLQRINMYQETDTHCGHGVGCFTVTDTREYTGSIIQHIAALKKMGYVINKI